jgi:glycosyltransferase involved in cell wall biosynthesis
LGTEDRRILHVLWALETGGGPVYQLVREQRRRGFEADVLAAGRAGHYGELARQAGAQVFELGQRGALDPTVARRAAAVFDQYSLAHFHAPEPLPVGVAAHRRGLRLVYTHRGGNRHYPLRKRARHRIVGHYLRSGFDAVTANTRQSAAAAAHIYGLPLESIAVVYNGLDFNLLTPTRDRESVLAELGARRDGVVRVGTAAMLRPLKRVDRLLRAVAALGEEPIHCYVIGDGPSRHELELLARQLGIEARVSFIGHKLHIGDYLQILDVFVLPSGPEEAFGNAAVEAMGVGLPSVVFHDGGGLTEHIQSEETGFIVPDQQGLEQRLRELVGDRELRLRIGKAASTAVRSRYTVDAMVSSYETLYDSIDD